MFTLVKSFGFQSQHAIHIICSMTAMAKVMNADKVSAILLHESHGALNEYFYNLLKMRNLFPSYCYSFLSTSIQTKLQAVILNTWISRKLVSMGTLST